MAAGIGRQTKFESSAAPGDRRAVIVAEVRLRGGASVRGLARVCGVSVGTIRRDLAALDHDGLVHKVYGGAVAPEVLAAVAG
jgi:DeoR/GlpR family transcriptional regulator of sugar metabolism